MAITDYDTLKAEVQNWAARSDSTFAARVPTFVAMAEDRIYYGAGSPGSSDYTPALRSTVMELTGTIAATSGDATLPAAFLEARSLTVVDQRTGIEYMPPERFAVMAENAASTAIPVYYTIKGTTLSVTPSYTGDLTLAYFRKFDAVTASATTGTLIESHGLIYLHLTLFAAFTWMRNADLALSHVALARSAIEGVNSKSALARFPGPLRIRPRVVMP